MPARDSERPRAPDLLRRLDDELQRAPLAVPHHQLAGVGPCEAAWQADRQVLERVSCPACAPCDAKKVCGGLPPLSFPNSGHAPHRHRCGACPLTPHSAQTRDQDNPRADGVSGSDIRPPWFDKPFADGLSPPGGPPARIVRLLDQVERVASHVACVSRSSTVMRVSSYTNAVAARK